MTGTGTGNPTEQTMPEEISESADVSQSAVSEDQVKLALRRVKDPELNLNIMDLGLVYGIRVDGSTVNVDMTLTSPACPSGPEIVSSVEKELRDLDGVEQVQTNIVWTPFWTPERIEPRVRAYLGL
jgi:metal-sulfur cluster biosynthetic enzyme